MRASALFRKQYRPIRAFSTVVENRVTPARAVPWARPVEKCGERRGRNVENGFRPEPGAGRPASRVAISRPRRAPPAGHAAPLRRPRRAPPPAGRNAPIWLPSRRDSSRRPAARRPRSARHSGRPAAAGPPAAPVAARSSFGPGRSGRTARGGQLVPHRVHRSQLVPHRVHDGQLVPHRVHRDPGRTGCRARFRVPRGCCWPAPPAGNARP